MNIRPKSAHVDLGLYFWKIPEIFGTGNCSCSGSVPTKNEFLWTRYDTQIREEMEDYR